jgi:hypothetical protein
MFPCVGNSCCSKNKRLAITGIRANIPHIWFCGGMVLPCGKKGGVDKARRSVGSQMKHYTFWNPLAVTGFKRAQRGGCKSLKGVGYAYA